MTRLQFLASAMVPFLARRRPSAEKVAKSLDRHFLYGNPVILTAQFRTHLATGTHCGACRRPRWANLPHMPPWPPR